MPSEQSQPPSQSASQPRPNPLRSSSSTLVQSRTDSPSSTPPQHPKPKAQKHVVGTGTGTGRLHTRVLSSKSIYKPTKAHGHEGSHTDLRLGKNASTTSLKKNSSAASLKRNRSHPDVTKGQRVSQSPKGQSTSVQFEIGDQEDVWEEASSSASPVLPRSASRSAVSSNHSSTKPSANNSKHHSPLESPIRAPVINGTSDHQSTRHTANARVITERLLQRVPSHHTTKMSLATAAASGSSPDYLAHSEGSTLNGTPKDNNGKEVVSRFVSGSGTPGENSPFLHNRKPSEHEPLRGTEEVKRAKSMGNLSRHNSEDAEVGEESALAPRATTTTHNQSRTQQKLWLQRASSNIEPQQMTPGAAINGGLHGGPLGVSPLVGAGDGRDPRIRLQSERTGLEYLVVRRHQDPIGAALKRLNQLPGADKNRRIPSQPKRADTWTAGAGPGRHGLSQSLKERGSKIKIKNAGPRSSFEEERAGQDDEGSEREDDGLVALVRGIWDRNYDLSASTD
ncbi:hypothetical protein B7494_g1367 [Chlorociboria aeruginascens]|nr:hypothetical protein B7494_g1367 [Chlorociboria aeruginascens]